MTADAGTAGQDPSEAEASRAAAPRPIDLILAGAHLRLGSLALARAELEILAREGGLDMPGQVDLAEARWRTGDLTGAGDVASIALVAGEDAAVAFAIAAEAAAALGRPNEARRLSNLAMDHVIGSIDTLFAGMPRSGVWPADTTEPPPTAGTMFHREPTPTVDHRAGDVDPGVSAARTAAADNGPAGAASSPLNLGFWDGDVGGAAPSNELPEPADELDGARDALVAGSLDEAVLRFALVLRLAPALAPAVLQATDGLFGPAIDLVRGDAYRLVGLESEARRAYAAAAWSGARDRRGKVDEAVLATDVDRRAVPAPGPAAVDAPLDIDRLAEPAPPEG